MNIREKLVEKIKELDPETALYLYDLALSYRREREVLSAASIRNGAMERCRRALKQLKGSLAEDIMNAREDRI